MLQRLNPLTSTAVLRLVGVLALIQLVRRNSIAFPGWRDGFATL